MGPTRPCGAPQTQGARGLLGLWLHPWPILGPLGLPVIPSGKMFFRQYLVLKKYLFLLHTNSKTNNLILDIGIYGSDNERTFPECFWCNPMRTMHLHAKSRGSCIHACDDLSRVHFFLTAKKILQTKIYDRFPICFHRWLRIVEDFTTMFRQTFFQP